MKILSIVLSARGTFRIVAGCALVLAAGCSAGPTPEEFEGARRNVPIDTPPTRQRPGVPDLEPRTALERALDLGGDFYRDDAGRLLARSILAHGGWEAWQNLETVSYELVRTAPAPEPSPEPAPEPSPEPAPAGGADAPAAGRTGSAVEVASSEPRRYRHSWSALERFLAEPAASGSVLPEFGAPGPAATGAATDPGAVDAAAVAELQVFALPHALAASRFRAEYIGVENDVRLGAMFEKCRYRVAGAPQASGWLLVYFDHATARVERLVTQRSDGSFLRVVFDDWMNAGGLQVPRLRKVFHLERTPYRHRDESAPDWVQALEGVELRGPIEAAGG